MKHFYRPALGLLLITVFSECSFSSIKKAHSVEQALRHIREDYYKTHEQFKSPFNAHRSNTYTHKKTVFWQNDHKSKPVWHSDVQDIDAYNGKLTKYEDKLVKYKALSEQSSTLGRIALRLSSTQPELSSLKFKNEDRASFSFLHAYTSIRGLGGLLPAKYLPDDLDIPFVENSLQYAPQGIFLSTLFGIREHTCLLFQEGWDTFINEQHKRHKEITQSTKEATLAKTRKKERALQEKKKAFEEEPELL